MVEISKDLVKKYAPLYFEASGLQTFIVNMRMARNRHASLIESFSALEANYKRYKERVEREFTPNNKLKMHGKPMRRKGR